MDPQDAIFSRYGPQRLQPIQTWQRLLRIIGTFLRLRLPNGTWFRDGNRFLFRFRRGDRFRFWNRLRDGC